MSKSSARPAPAPARSSRLWPALFALSLVANLVFAWIALRAPRPSAGAAASSENSATSAASSARSSKPPPELAPYAALGSFVAENNRIADLKWSEAQFAAFAEGLRASYEGRGYPLDEDARKLRDDINARVQQMLAAERPDPVEEYFKTLRDRENVKRTTSGLHYRITEEGTGQSPSASSTVVISYAARLPSGESLPALSRTRVRTAVADLLPGLQEGVQLLVPGAKALVYLPAALSFGDGQWPQTVPKGAPVVFFLELHEVED